MAGLYSHTTRGTGTVLTAAIYNTDHQNHIDNHIPQQMDDYSSNAAQMQSATDPGESGTESLPTSLAGELERLRFAIKDAKAWLEIEPASPQWYSTPTAFVPVTKGGTGSGTAAGARAALGAAALADGFTTGDEKLTWKTTADAGWILLDDGTIGSAASGATTRANADTEALYTLWWNNCADAQCPVSGGRGASAAADFAADKTLKTPLTLGRVLAIAGAGAGLTSRVLGLATGGETHTLTQAETPLKSHIHGHSATHAHGPGSLSAAGNASAQGVGSTTKPQQTDTGNAGTNFGDPVTSGATAAASPGNTDAASDATASAFSLMNPSGFRNVMVKL